MKRTIQINVVLVVLLSMTLSVAAQTTGRARSTDSLVVAGTKIYNVKDLYSLRPTYQMELDHYFADKARLIDCNEQLVKSVKKAKALKEFKYFETNGGFGIISSIEKVRQEENEDGTIKRNFFQKLFGLGGSSISCKRVYIFLVITNDLNEELTPDYNYLSKIYKTRQLERKWANIATLDALLKNPQSIYNSQQHTFVVRVYEFKKEQLAKEFKFVPGDTGYVLDPKIQELFKSSAR